MILALLGFLPLNYDAAHQQWEAERCTRPIVVFVGCTPRRVPGAIVAFLPNDATRGLPRNCIVVSGEVYTRHIGYILPPHSGNRTIQTYYPAVGYWWLYCGALRDEAHFARQATPLGEFDCWVLLSA